MIPKRNSHHPGFALLEVLIIVAIVGLGMIPIFSLLGQTAKQVSFNESMVVANLWAVQLIERYRMTPFTELNKNFSKPVDGKSLLTSDPLLMKLWDNNLVDSRSQNFFKKYKVTLQFIDDPKLTGILGKLLCTVAWTDTRGAIRQEERYIILENQPQ